MGHLQLSVVQMNSEHLQVSTNLDRIESWISEESAVGADLVIFPELATTGYLEPVTPDDAYSPTVSGDETRQDFIARFAQCAEPIPGPSTERLTRLAARHDIAVAVGILERLPKAGGLLANTVVMVGPHGILGYQRKMHMPWNEKHIFVPGDQLNLFQYRGIHIGVNVCYDAYFPEQSRILTLKGADLILSCFTGPKRSSENDSRIPTDRASILARARALENTVYFVAVNRVGTQGKYFFIGNSAISGPDGELVAVTDSVKPVAIRARIDTDTLKHARLGLSPVRDRRPHLYRDLSTPLETIIDTA